ISTWRSFCTINCERIKEYKCLFLLFICARKRSTRVHVGERSCDQLNRKAQGRISRFISVIDRPISVRAPGIIGVVIRPPVSEHYNVWETVHFMSPNAAGAGSAAFVESVRLMAMLSAARPDVTFIVHAI